MVVLERQVHYGYGLLFGFLLALMAYNAMLYLGRRDPAHLLYAVYLISVVLLNFAYTGHGLAWLWPGQLGLQRYVILIAMVVFSACGLLFANRFLQLARLAPRLHKTVMAWCLASLALMAVLVLFDQHLGAAWFAFAGVLAFTVAMVGLGTFTWRRGHMEARYFLSAAVCGMVGTATTAFAVLGWLPMTTATYHSLELGIALDATLLALALAYQMRQQQQQSLQATYLANHDPLTELHNRRGFLERARAAYSVAVRSDRPVAIVLLDLDHFKQINDQFGHEAGDQVLARSAKLLASAGRAGDVLARWGGEEFILFLPDTDLGQAAAFAERLRQSMADLRVTHQQTELQLTASFGVAQRHSQTTLEELIKLADQALYEAKRTGRNRIVASDPVSQTQSPLFG
jgi:diguanylate cyclase (GGDEF)-like protein